LAGATTFEAEKSEWMVLLNRTSEIIKSDFEYLMKEYNV